MRLLASVTHRCLVLAEHAALRLLIVALGFVMMIVGLALGVTMVMLPVGLVVGLLGVSLFVMGTVGEIPLEQ